MPDPQPYPLIDIPVGDVTFQHCDGNELNWCMEDLSVAYMCGIVAQAGLQTKNHWRHDDGIDIVVGCSKAIVNGVARRHPEVLFQIKATSHPEFDGDNFVYRFKKRTKYEELRALATHPQALILYVMPHDRKHWLMPCPNHADFVGHAFFYNMASAPALGEEDAPKVMIPQIHRITTRSFIDFFHAAIVAHYQ